MRKLLIGLGAAAALVLLLMLISYNSLVTKEEAVTAAWSQTQVQLERRAALIPNLVNTVQGYASHEREVFAEVTATRARVGQVTSVSPGQLANDPAAQQRLLEANAQLNASFGRLIAVAESYPQLKASDLFRDLMAELSGTENRVGVARGRAVAVTR